MIKSIDLICPKKPDDNSKEVIENSVDTAKLIESLTAKISEVVEMQTTSAEVISATIKEALNEIKTQEVHEENKEEN